MLCEPCTLRDVCTVTYGGYEFFLVYQGKFFLSSSNTLFKKNNIYINRISFREMFDIVDYPESEYSGLILKNIIISGIMLNVMAQISISVLPEKMDYIDKLPSYKDVKKKFISSYIGRTVAACNGVAKAYPWLMQDSIMQGNDINLKISKIIFDLVDNPTPNVRRVKPSIGEWQIYTKGEAGAALGQMLSCPATNLRILNIDGSQVSRYGLNEAFEVLGIDQHILDKYSVNLHDISNDIRSIYLLNGSGMPVNFLQYRESEIVYSKIQEEILGGHIVRIDPKNNGIYQDRDFNKINQPVHLENYLTKYELIAYNFAIKSRDKNILKKYTDLLKQRLNNNLLLLNYESRVH